jgi:hypothetical protein
MSAIMKGRIVDITEGETVHVRLNDHEPIEFPCDDLLLIPDDGSQVVVSREDLTKMDTLAAMIANHSTDDIASSAARDIGYIIAAILGTEGGGDR